MDHSAAGHNSVKTAGNSWLRQQGAIRGSKVKLPFRDLDLLPGELLLIAGSLVLLVAFAWGFV